MKCPDLKIGMFLLVVLSLLSSCVKIELLSEPCNGKIESPVFVINNSTIQSSDTIRYTIVGDSGTTSFIKTPDGKTVENGESIIAYGAGIQTYEAFSRIGPCNSDFTKLSVKINPPVPTCNPQQGRFSLGTAFVPNVFNGTAGISDYPDDHIGIEYGGSLSFKINGQLDTLTVYSITGNSYLQKGEMNANFVAGFSIYKGQSGKMYVSLDNTGVYTLTFCNMSFQSVNSGTLSSGGVGRLKCSRY